MKIAIFCETYLPYINGVVTHIKLLKEGLERMGHEVLIVTADPRTRHHYIKDHVLYCPARESKRLYGYGIASPLSRRRLKLIREFDPNIIHIHQEFGVGLSGFMIAKVLHKPIVYTLHTMYDEYIYYVAPKPLIPVVRSLSHTYSRILAKAASELTGPSPKVEEYFKKVGAKKQVNVVPNSVELSNFEPSKITEEQKAAVYKKLNIPKDKKIACFCGRLGKEKSVDVLLQYWAEQIKPEDNILLMVIGDGPELENLQRQAKELDIEDTVIFTGKVLHEELPPYLAVCDMYITASLSDTNSISMLEAMAVGLPVLHRKDPLNKGQVLAGVNGYIYDNSAELFDHIHDLMTMEEDRKKTLRRSVIESVKKSGAEDLANHILTIYNRLYLPVDKR